MLIFKSINIKKKYALSSSGHNLKWYSSKPGDDDPSKYLDEEEKTEDEKTYDLITSKYFKVGYIACIHYIINILY